MSEWLFDPLNSEIVASGVNLLAAVLASLTAILIGIVSYPRQRKLDRQLEKAKERRDIYRSFMKKAGRLDLLIAGSADNLAYLGELKAAQFEVALIGSKEVGHYSGHLVSFIETLAMRAQKDDRPTQDEFAKITEETTAIWRGLVEAMRAEF